MTATTTMNGRPQRKQLGDQLDRNNAALLAADKSRDTIVMLEVMAESCHVPSHKARTVLFLSAMRHHAHQLRADGWKIHYTVLDDPLNTQTFGSELARAAASLNAAHVLMLEPGEHRVRANIQQACKDHALALTMLEDTHFLTTHAVSYTHLTLPTNREV